MPRICIVRVDDEEEAGSLILPSELPSRTLKGGPGRGRTRPPALRRPGFKGEGVGRKADDDRERGYDEEVGDAQHQPGLDISDAPSQASPCLQEATEHWLLGGWR